MYCCTANHRNFTGARVHKDHNTLGHGRESSLPIIRVSGMGSVRPGRCIIRPPVRLFFGLLYCTNKRSTDNQIHTGVKKPG